MKPEPRRTRSGAGPSDAALVVSAKAGEMWAQEALFQRYATMVNGLAYRLLGSDDELDDLVQDSFVQALRSLDSLANPQAFAAWLGSIVVRTARKRIRKRRMLSRLGLRDAGAADPDVLQGQSIPPEVSAELRSVYAVLDRLPADQRVALVLHRVEGLSLPEVAERLGISLSTAKRRIAGARHRLDKLRARGEVDA